MNDDDPNSVYWPYSVSERMAVSLHAMQGLGPDSQKIETPDRPQSETQNDTADDRPGS